MGQKIRKAFITFFLFVCTLLIWGGLTTSSAQLLLENDSPLEIRFSQGATERSQGTVTVSLADIQSILSEEFTLAEDQWQLLGSSENQATNYFVLENNTSVAPGRFQIDDFSYQTFFASSFKNNSGHSIGNLILAYDFIFNSYNNTTAPELELMYRVNQGEWKSVQSGVIRSSSLRSEEDTWSSFSIHLNIDDIFLRQSDEIHFVWIIDETTPVSSVVPMALQRIEIFPKKIEQNKLERGDLIITEILPRSTVNGSDFEYIEVYNPSENRISLKGVEVFTSQGSQVIQQDVYVDPYDFTILSNVDISSLEGVLNSYFYNGSIIPANRGRVGLERQGSLIASAAYEASEPGLALELTQVSRAYDGYSSLQNFEPSQSTYFQDLYGSPGTRGHTNPMYTKQLVEQGLYILTLPGNVIQRLSSHSSLEFYSLDGEAITLDAIIPHEPILVQKTDNTPVTLFIESETSINSPEFEITYLTSSSYFISTPVYNRGEKSAQKSLANISRITPVIQKWNRQNQKFELVRSGQSFDDYWSPFILNRSVSSLIRNTENRITGPVLDRFIEFTLVQENERERYSSDLAMLGFMDIPAQLSQLRYDLPKLELILPNDSEIGRQPLLYFTSALSEENYNSFTHLPFDINQQYEIGLGTKMAESTGSAVIRWDLNDELPEEWVLTLEDTFDGTTVNLREVNEYRFRFSSTVSEVDGNQDDNPKVGVLSPEGRSRFLLKIQPYSSFTENTEELETPDKIELRPNYPNPFNPSTNINFYLPEERTVRVGIYNVVGQQVALLLDDTVRQGEHSLVWDASDKPSGIYIVQLETGNRIFTRKITLIK